MTHEELQIRACCVQAHTLVSMTFGECGVRLRGKVADAAAMTARRVAFELVMADASFAASVTDLHSVPADLVADIHRLVHRARSSYARMPHAVSSSVH